MPALEKRKREEKETNLATTTVRIGNAVVAVFSKNLNFFLLKFNMVCTFWIVLMC
jgi:hypothetical protein